ncbi:MULTISPECIES: Glu/Leu/Phe/Val family dehydrogenase [Amycolatopsis]|uniref:Valine dehydrogenase n=1 Tax=Amycolatopsis bullii TaxID=941987 RepID=A0ABQ3KP67_9PSEU|nr:Glu/Leu/Phe/Val dehydrogenase dimerization domain-containing protein [Amycolatopsis bullii]GHG41462.1 valine dehydrogenase [Amycolatopsis bullii]
MLPTIPGDRPEPEQVSFREDAESGLKAIIVVHSTALGPALGGTRFHPYPSERDALADVLRLAEGMAYKSALAGLPLGGGKAVIIGDPRTDKSEQLLRAYGRFVGEHGGRYITACDVGTFPEDMDVVAAECAFVTGRSAAGGGAGDSAILTAAGVLEGLAAAARHRWGTAELAGRRIGVEGVGKVGRRVVAQLLAAGAVVIASDVDETALAALPPAVEIAAGRDELAAADLDVYCPCALGGVLTARLAETLTAKIVCGAANNQLAEPEVAGLLDEAGILYAPDYVVNAGGLIQVAEELGGFDFTRAAARVQEIRRTTGSILELAKEQATTPVAAADALAERLMAEAGHGTSRAGLRVVSP